MRKQQKTYQEARPSSQESRDALIASKRLETEIDQEIARVQAILAKKDIFLVQYKDVDGSIASSLVEGFDMETQYRQGYIVANITKRTVTYNGKDWEAMTLKPGSSMSKAEQYVQKLKECQDLEGNGIDEEEAHCDADRILLDIIRNELGEEYKQVIEEYEKVPKWYA